MSNALESINEIYSVIEETEFEVLTKEQLSKLGNNNNTYFGRMEIADTDSYIMFLIPKRSFDKFEYYCGMEYEKDEIEYKLETQDSVLVVYGSGCERASEIVYRATGKQVGDYEDEDEDNE